MKIIPSLEVPEQTSIAGLAGAELPTTGVLPTPVSPWSLSEKLDYSGDEDVDGMMCILLLIPANISI